jgi:hypothetical protein
MSIKTAIFAGSIVLFALAPLPARAMDGVMMKDGKMMMMKDGQATAPMSTDMSMSDGTKVTTSGVVMMKNGTQEKLKNGEMMLMNGHVMKGGKAMPMKPESE